MELEMKLNETERNSPETETVLNSPKTGLKR